MTSDQRHPFEYIFTDVNFINQSSTSNNSRGQTSLYVSNSQNEYQNVQTLAAYPASTSNTVQNTTLFPSPNSNHKHDFPSEGYEATNTSINLEVDTDDLDFAPSPDGELMSGKTSHTRLATSILYTRVRNICLGWPVYGVKRLCSRAGK